MSSRVKRFKVIIAHDPDELETALNDWTKDGEWALHSVITEGASEGFVYTIILQQFY